MVGLDLSALSIAKFIIAQSVSSVIRSYVKGVVTPENVLAHAQIWITAAALGGLAGEASGERFERKLKEWRPVVEELNRRLQETQEAVQPPK